MNRKGSSITGYIVVLLFISSFTAAFTGCAASGWGRRDMTFVSRYFEKDTDTVWNAVVQAVEGIPIETKDKEKGFLKTQWVKGWSTKKSMGLILEGQWQERYRLLIKVAGEQHKTYVSIDTQIEEKAPGGSRAFRWERTPSDGTIEQAFLKKLENILSQ